MSVVVGYTFESWSSDNVNSSYTGLVVKYAPTTEGYTKMWYISGSATLYVEPDQTGPDASFYLSGVRSEVSFKFTEVNTINGAARPADYQGTFTAIQRALP